MPNKEVDAVMTVNEVAKYLKLTESTIYRLARAGELPGRKVGGVWRFSREALDKWLAAEPNGQESHG